MTGPVIFGTSVLGRHLQLDPVTSSIDGHEKSRGNTTSNLKFQHAYIIVVGNFKSSCVQALTRILRILQSKSRNVRFWTIHLKHNGFLKCNRIFIENLQGKEWCVRLDLKVGDHENF